MEKFLYEVGVVLDKSVEYPQSERRYWIVAKDTYEAHKLACLELCTNVTLDPSYKIERIGLHRIDPSRVIGLNDG